MKTTKGGKVMNPTDAYRKELRKKELKRNKKERKKVREVGILKKDPETIKEQIDKLEMMKADGALDKARKHKKRQLQDTYNLVMKKRKEYVEKMREKGEEPVMFSHLGPLRRRTSAEEEDRVKHPKPEDSVYYHPELNPTGAPPPGKPPMYKSSIGPRIPLPGSSALASSSNAESEDITLAAPPPPPLPPPLPDSESSIQASVDDSAVLSSLPLPPPPPAPPKPTSDPSVSLPQPKEPVKAQTSLPPPPPPPVQRPSLSSTLGVGGETENNKFTLSEGTNQKQSNSATSVLPPPPPPPGLPPKSTNHHSEATSSNPNGDISKIFPLPPPPPRQPPPPPHGQPLAPPLQPGMMLQGIVRFPPPPPDMRPPLPLPGPPSRLPPPPPPGMVAPSAPRPPFGPPPGPPPMLRPPFPLGLSLQEDEPAAMRPSAPPKPSYVKSAASTVVKRPLAQHNPELTSMIPASVRVRRESVVPKAKPKPQHSVSAAAVSRPSAPMIILRKPEAGGSTSSAPKIHSIDESYMAFLEDMKSLGALDE